MLGLFRLIVASSDPFESKAVLILRPCSGFHASFCYTTVASSPDFIWEWPGDEANTTELCRWVVSSYGNEVDLVSQWLHIYTTEWHLCFMGFSKI